MMFPGVVKLTFKSAPQVDPFSLIKLKSPQVSLGSFGPT